MFCGVSTDRKSQLEHAAGRTVAALSETATEFEARFATEDDCRAYWVEARWGGEPACARCHGTRVWTIRDGTTFECADCDHQTSLTSGHGAREDAQAVQDVVPRRVRDLDPAHRHLCQGPAAHHGLRLLQDGLELAAQAARGDGAPRCAEPLRPFVQADETLVGGKRRAPTRSWFMRGGRGRTEGCVSPTPTTTMKATLKSLRRQPDRLRRPRS